MKKIKQLLLCSVATVTLFSSCDKDGPHTTPVAITVKSGISGSVAANAVVKLYEDANSANGGESNYASTTDASGIVKFNVDHAGLYYIVVEKGTEKNYYNGLIPVGIFKTQAEIASSPTQTPFAVIGSVKFKDVNGDGAITDADKGLAPSIFLEQSAANNAEIAIY